MLVWYAAISLCLLILPIVCDAVLSFCGYELLNGIAKFYRVYSIESLAERSDAMLLKFFSIRK